MQVEPPGALLVVAVGEAAVQIAGVEGKQSGPGWGGQGAGAPVVGGGGRVPGAAVGLVVEPDGHRHYLGQGHGVVGGEGVLPGALEQAAVHAELGGVGIPGVLRHVGEGAGREGQQGGEGQGQGQETGFHGVSSLFMCGRGRWSWLNGPAHIPMKQVLQVLLKLCVRRVIQAVALIEGPDGPLLRCGAEPGGGGEHGCAHRRGERQSQQGGDGPSHFLGTRTSLPPM